MIDTRISRHLYLFYIVNLDIWQTAVGLKNSQAAILSMMYFNMRISSNPRKDSILRNKTKCPRIFGLCMNETEPSETTSVTIEVGPPKYQTTIDKKARKALGIEGKKAVLQADLTVKRIVDEDDGGDQ